MTCARRPTEDFARNGERPPVTCPEHPEYKGAYKPVPHRQEPQGCVGCWRVFCSLPSCWGPGVRA